MINSKNFNAILFTGDVSKGDKGYITYMKQTSIKRLELYFNDKYPNWKYYTMYDRITNEKTVIKRGC